MKSIKKTATKQVMPQKSSAKPIQKATSKKPTGTGKLKKGTPAGFPKQQQSKQPGSETPMRPDPVSKPVAAPGKKLEGETLIISGGDSGIGKAIALLFAAHGANIVVAYLNEHTDARKTEAAVKKHGVQTLFIAGDIT